ncbi:MAG: ChbG/HpnK family deacetylase [Candidatus Rokubacteria bacterium]|nr:ChbG/HpnK family deacetylase [Candidatus Rokubacteria bacterium]
MRRRSRRPGCRARWSATSWRGALVRRLIVNADDFGLTPGVSAGILLAHRHGIVTSTTMLVNRGVPKDTVARARDAGLGLGLHVNLTLGAPLTRGASLVEGGGFVRDPRRAAARAKAGEVEKEVAAQIERFESLVKARPTHVDTHHHVGLHEPVRAAVLAAARRLGVPVRSQDPDARARARVAGLRTPDHFFGESGPDAYWSLARTLRHLRTLPPGTSEFMTHPGWCDAELTYSRYGRQREVELAALGSAAARAAAHALGITLADFRAL